jgi:hypothetical protein
MTASMVSFSALGCAGVVSAFPGLLELGPDVLKLLAAEAARTFRNQSCSDSRGSPAYLETDVDRNVALYEEFGFKVMGRRISQLRRL